MMVVLKKKYLTLRVSTCILFEIIFYFFKIKSVEIRGVTEWYQSRKRFYNLYWTLRVGNITFALSLGCVFGSKIFLKCFARGAKFKMRIKLIFKTMEVFLVRIAYALSVDFN